MYVDTSLALWAVTLAVPLVKYDSLGKMNVFAVQKTSVKLG